MRVLVDANVLLDVVMQRPGFFVEASEVWKAAEQHEFEALVSAISFTTIHYILRRHSGKAAADEAVQLIARIFSVAAVDSTDIGQALANPGADFEDAVQAASGHRAFATHVVTRDPAGFKTSELLAISPGEHVARTVDADNLREGRANWPGALLRHTSRHLFDRVAPHSQPLWGFRLVRTVVDRLAVDSPELTPLIRFANDKADWSKGHELFSTLGAAIRTLMKQQPRSSEQELRIPLLHLAELVARIAYNATNPSDPFDDDTGWGIAVSAAVVCRIVADPGLSDAVWDALVQPI